MHTSPDVVLIIKNSYVDSCLTLPPDCFQQSIPKALQHSDWGSALCCFMHYWGPLVHPKKPLNRESFKLLTQQWRPKKSKVISTSFLTAPPALQQTTISVFHNTKEFSVEVGAVCSQSQRETRWTVMLVEREGFCVCKQNAEDVCLRISDVSNFLVHRCLLGSIFSHELSGTLLFSDFKHLQW